MPAELSKSGLGSAAAAAAAGVLLPASFKHSSAPVEVAAAGYEVPERADSRIHQLEQLVHDVDRQLRLVGGGGPGPDALDELERRAAAEPPAELVINLEPEEAADYPAEYAADYGDYGDYGDLEPIPLSVRSDPEFRRAERLDIKKPGPWFGVNNYAFDYDFDGKAPVPDDVSKIYLSCTTSPAYCERGCRPSKSLYG